MMAQRRQWIMVWLGVIFMSGSVQAAEMCYTTSAADDVAMAWVASRDGTTVAQSFQAIITSALSQVGVEAKRSIETMIRKSSEDCLNADKQFTVGPAISGTLVTSCK